MVTDPVQRDAALKAGTGDIAPASPTNVADLSKTFSMSVSPAVTTTGFVMQEGHAPFSDKSLRRAMTLALDVDEYNRLIGQNAYETAHTMFPTNYPYTDASLSLPKPDPVQAQKLVDDYVNTRTPGHDIDFSYSYVSTGPAGRPGRPAGADPAATPQPRARHAAAGDDRSVRRQPHCRQLRRRHPVVLGCRSRARFSEAVVCKGSRNLYDYCNPAVDQAITDSRTTLDPAARIQDLKAVQRLLIDDAFFVPLGHGGSMFAAKSTVKDCGHVRRRRTVDRPDLAEVAGAALRKIIFANHCRA